MEKEIRDYAKKYHISDEDIDSIFKIIELLKIDSNDTTALLELVEYFLRLPLAPKVKFAAKISLIDLVNKQGIPIQDLYEKSLIYIIDNKLDIDNLMKLAGIISSQATKQEIRTDGIQLNLQEFMNYLNKYLAEHYEEMRNSCADKDEFTRKYVAAINKFHMFHKLEMYEPLDMMIERRSSIRSRVLINN